MNWKKYGFTQRKPVQSGVYYIAGINICTMVNAPPRIIIGWDIGEITFSSGSYGNEQSMHWRVKLLEGIDMPWRKGMWIKGPINPL